jgi:hypothetical protein
MEAGQRSPSGHGQEAVVITAMRRFPMAGRWPLAATAVMRVHSQKVLGGVPSQGGARATAGDIQSVKDFEA